MKTFAIALLVAALAVPAANAATVWDETVNGDLSSSEAAPTPIALAIGSNVLAGTINGLPLDRDYITFTVPSGFILTQMNLATFTPNNLAFSALNTGSTSYVPSGATNGLFLSGIHITSADIGFNLLTFFDTRNVTTNSLPSPGLGAGTYCWMIQQTNPIVQTWKVDLILQGVVATEPTTWGKVKSLYR
jgi:hypothetical protein